MKSILTFITLSAILFIACEKESLNFPSGGNTADNRQLKVNVYYVENINELKPLGGVFLEVYNDREDLLYRQNRFKYSYADSNGFGLFEFMPADDYYVVSFDTSRGELIDSVSIPGSAVVSFLEIVYF